MTDAADDPRVAEVKELTEQLAVSRQDGADLLQSRTKACAEMVAAYGSAAWPVITRAAGVSRQAIEKQIVRLGKG